jgi:hypothetical protein
MVEIVLGVRAMTVSLAIVRQKWFGPNEAR